MTFDVVVISGSPFLCLSSAAPVLNRLARPAYGRRGWATNAPILSASAWVSTGLRISENSSFVAISVALVTYPVSRMAGSWGRSRRASRKRSSPSIPGIDRSQTSTSGAS